MFHLPLCHLRTSVSAVKYRPGVVHRQDVSPSQPGSWETNPLFADDGGIIVHPFDRDRIHHRRIQVTYIKCLLDKALQRHNSAVCEIECDMQ